MTARHKNKTLAALLAVFLGGFGMHRFYLHGMKDLFGWTHLATLPLSLLLVLLHPEQQWLFTTMPLILSALAGVLAALSIGLTADEKWDAKYNQSSGRTSSSGWILVILLILSFGFGAVGAITLIARSFDLLYTGGAYG